MKLGKNRIHLLIMLVTVLSLLVHVPSNAYAVDTWTDATTNAGNVILFGVSMSDASNGVTVGSLGTIAYTTNGGVDWTAATTTNVGGTQMNAVSMSDVNNGVAVGNSGTIVYTSDGGDTWTAATTTNVGANRMDAVSMSDANNGVAVGSAGTIVYTSDGGDTWTAATTPLDITNMRGVSMSDANNGVAVGNAGTIVFAGSASSEDSTTGEEKKSDTECNDCTAPSLGISQNHKDPVRVIDDGITFNEKSFDVREFAKIYDTIHTETGVTNTIQLKIYEDSKPENVRKAILYLGLDSSDIYRNLACIIWENNSYGEKTITIIDKFDLFEDESATATIDGDILFLNYTFTSKIPIPTSTMAVELRDNYYNFGLNYFENVIKVSGNPLIASTGTVSKNNSVQTLIVDTFQNESSGSQNDVMPPEFESGAPYEIPSIMIADTSQWGFSDVMTQRYLADIEETIQQNDSKIQAMRNADVPIEIPVVEEELPRIEENLLQIEQQKAQLILNEILREDIHNWKKVYDPQTFEIDVKQVSALTGMSYDSLQPWMSNLETWVAEGTIDSSELVIAVEYLTNN